MSYEEFAYLYDELMNDAPYDKWLETFQRNINKFHPECKQVLDLACGTGAFSLLLHEAGFQVSGLDLSEDMLAVAQAKVIEKGYPITFFHQDMTELTGFTDLDAVVIFCDSLCYLREDEQFINTFKSVYNSLNEGGIFLFDVHSTYKMESVYAGKTFAYNGEEISYIWNSFQGEDGPNTIEHDLTFFVKDDVTGQYDRLEELHLQRTYPISQYKSWLKQIGFTVLLVEADFEEKAPQDTSERIFFVAKK